MASPRFGRFTVVDCLLCNEFAAGLRTPAAREVASGRTRTTGSIIITQHEGTVTVAAILLLVFTGQQRKLVLVVTVPVDAGCKPRCRTLQRGFGVGESGGHLLTSRWAMAFLQKFAENL